MMKLIWAEYFILLIQFVTFLIWSSHERNIFMPYVRTDVCSYTNNYSFLPHTASLWNNKLQETVKETQSSDIFKSRIQS